MTATISARSPQFKQATINTIGILDTAMVKLRQWRRDIDEFEDVQGLSYLYSLALLARHRALHLVDAVPAEIDVDQNYSLCELLASAHDQLIEQTSGLDQFFVLEFVNEVGALCRGVRRYVDRH